ncbi:hypothetical protein [Deinococcus arenicola]|uniref:Type IV secretion system protein n=1 Tax=Deinococcus arenicola TaxID=2994950 RepID=A0ABU4DWM4_9DEIO|nr:hypothetical protein [Deinococcus sp. ZS9-10]MDV6376342.1 hypothetical protein [Deinococcus sp. ZS9-10]
MKLSRILVPLLLLTLVSMADANTFNTYQKVFMGNPLEMVNDLNTQLKQSGIGPNIKKLAYAIAVAGFFFQLWKGLGRNNRGEMRATIVQAIGVSIMLSLVTVIHQAVITSWNTTYTTSNVMFTKDLSKKIDEAGTQMSNMIGTVAEVATMGTTAAAYGAKALGTGAALKSGGGFLAKTGSRLGAGAIALSGFTIMYASIIAIAGFIVLAVGYVLPLAIAFTMWGQTTAIWACISSTLGAILVTALIPLLAFSAIDRAFIKPAEATNQFISQNGFAASWDTAGARLTENEFYKQTRAEMAACKARAASATDGESVDCTDEKSANIIGKAYGFVAAKIGDYFETFKGIAAQLFDSITGAIMQILLSIIYFIAAMIFMGAAVNFLTTILGGVASYAGAVSKGGG